MSGERPTPGPSVLSLRQTPRIEYLWLVCIMREGVEGVVRRDTPSGAQPWLTDDPSVREPILAMARESSGFEDAYLAEFIRVVHR